jgi:hypothetical protein
MKFRNLNEYLEILRGKSIRKLENVERGPKSTHGLVTPAWPKGQIARTAHVGGTPARALGVVVAPMAGAVACLLAARC